MNATTTRPDEIVCVRGGEPTLDQMETIEAMRDLEKVEVAGANHAGESYGDGRVGLRVWKNGDWRSGPFLSADGKFIDRVTLKEGKRLGMTREEIEARNEGYEARWESWVARLRGGEGQGRR